MRMRLDKFLFGVKVIVTAALIAAKEPQAFVEAVGQYLFENVEVGASVA